MTVYKKRRKTYVIFYSHGNHKSATC